MDYKKSLNIFFKAISIIFLLCILILKLYPIIYLSFHRYLSPNISDYFIFHYSFENVWQHKPSEWLYDCMKLQAGIINEYHITPADNACFLYPPHFAVLLSSFAILPLGLAEHVWNSLFNILYILGIIIFIKIIFKEKREKHFKYIITLVLIMSMLHYPFLFDFQMSNSNRLTFFLIATMFYFLYEKKRDFLAGILLGLAIVFKITPAIILVFYLLKGRMKLTLGTLFSILISTLLVIFSVGWQVLWKYATKYFWSFSNTLAHFGVPYDNSLQGMLSTYLPDLPVKYIFYFYILLMFCLYIYLLRKCDDIKLEIGLISLSPLIFSPHLEVHHMILTLFAQIILIHYVWLYKQTDIFRSILIFLYLVIFYIFSFVDISSAKGEHFFGLMIIFILLLVTFNRKKNK